MNRIALLLLIIFVPGIALVCGFELRNKKTEPQINDLRPIMPPTIKARWPKTGARRATAQ